MKTKFFVYIRKLIGVTPLIVGTSLYAAPPTWFPGPSLDTPISGAATSVISGGNNLLIGGDSWYYPYSYPQSLAATNIYWTYLSELYSVNIAPGAVANGGMIILYGGSDGTNSMSTVIGYSPSGDASQTLHSMSVARSYLGYAPDRNGYAYALGGLDDSGQPLSSAERYNPDLDTWAAIAKLPTTLYNFPAVFNRTNYIYIFGGLTNTTSGTETAAVLRYSVSGNSWTSMAPMPVAVAGSAATLGPDGKIYVVGGTSGGVATSTVQVYNPAANSWVISTPLPEGLSLAAMGVDSLGRLIVMGGMDINGNDVGDVWRSQQLNVPDSAPSFVSYPSLAATYQVPYVSSINATGNPQPTYLVLSGPVGMQVDTYSGAITWTPPASQIGTNSVTIRATNYAGYIDWNFNITVPNPPPAILTNLTVVSVTENSVTLSWDPESPIVGPATYSVYLRHVLHDPKGSGATIWYTQIGSTTTLPSITIFGLTPGLTQTYYVVATAPGGTSGYAGITASTLRPQPPTNLRVTGLTSTSISLEWDPSPGPVPIARYEIWGWINNGITYTSYGTNFTGTTATITGLVPGSMHEWGVRAYDAQGYASGFDYGPTVSNPVPTPATLSTGVTMANGGFQFTASEGGFVLQTVLIQATANPADPNSWVQIGSLLPTANPFTFTDTNAAQFPNRFYRIVAP
ncbi:MAG: hypothetical protein JWR26_1765 [Pedosphaera sp.]|nr:hypothetical protein [Pedosphaera sp.]